MIKEVELVIHPDKILDHDEIRGSSARKLKLHPVEIKAAQIIRKSIDARSKVPHFRVLVRVFINESPVPEVHRHEYRPAGSDKKSIIIGFGPAGMFAALRLIELGIKPMIFERGKDVQARRRDLRGIQQEGLVDPDSNYCFGEGGAGTYSDGKLYTRSVKRGNVGRILNILFDHGAPGEILIDAHPHIGSNKLPNVVKAIRERVIDCGGEVNFNSKMTDLIVEKNKIRGVVINNSAEILSDSVILATGHSARDIYYLLSSKKIRIESKEFAMGVRIEHPQSLIDKIRYHSETRHPNLPASSYNLSCQVEGKGVYSFCMCPGGIIIPASTAPDELVLNGMSVSRRDSPYANSGLVVTVDESDWKSHESEGVFAGLSFQRQVEKSAFEAGGGKQKAPAQRLTDFVERRISRDLPGTSYIPGIVSVPLHEILPGSIAKRLMSGLGIFDKKMRGYYTAEANLLAAETRTSSPIRIPRDGNHMHASIEGLFPCGEGAGFAGGIVSAAIDGERTAEAVSRYLFD